VPALVEVRVWNTSHIGNYLVNLREDRLRNCFHLFERIAEDAIILSGALLVAHFNPGAQFRQFTFGQKHAYRRPAFRVGL
jgi:hypothetical protein